MSDRRPVHEWCDLFDIEIIDWSAYDFYEDKVTTFQEFANKITQCGIAAQSRESWQRFITRCQRMR